MKLKIIELMNCYAVLNELSANKTNNIKGIYRIAKINKMLKSEIELIDEQRMTIIKKYCEIDSNGQPRIEDGQYIIKPENNQQLQQELNEFLLIENNINIEPLTLADLEGFDLSSKQLIELLVIMEEQ